MRLPKKLSIISIVGFFLLTGVPSSATVRDFSPPPSERGYPEHLINRPVCWTIPMPNAGASCRADDMQYRGSGPLFD
jgi:hypothetical protein